MIDGSTMILVGIAIQLIPPLHTAVIRVRRRQGLRRGLAALGWTMLPAGSAEIDALAARAGIALGTR